MGLGHLHKTFDNTDLRTSSCSSHPCQVSREAQPLWITGQEGQTARVRQTQEAKSLGHQLLILSMWDIKLHNQQLSPGLHFLALLMA